MKLGWLVVLVVSACGGWTSSTDKTTATPAAPLDQARGYERGTGAARDYRAAAEVYRAACDHGRGNLVACDALIRAYLHGRGVDTRAIAGRELASEVCLARKDPFACVAADAMAGWGPVLPQPLRDTITDVAGNLEPCDVTHLADCRAQLLVSASDAGRDVGRRRRQLRLQACRVGLVEGCVEILRARRPSNGEVGEAQRQLQTACDAHDAEACVAAPSRTPVPLAELCTASDYEACARLGCQGDPAARQRAADHGFRLGDCRRFEEPSDDGSADTAIAKFTEFRDRMCACPDKTCADHITEDMTKWGQDQAKHASGNDARVSKEDTKRFAAVVEDMTKCMTRALMTP